MSWVSTIFFSKIENTGNQESSIVISATWGYENFQPFHFIWEIVIFQIINLGRFLLRKISSSNPR